MIDRDECVALAITMLSAAAQLFPSASEFSDSVAHARSEILNLHPSPSQLTQ